VIEVKSRPDFATGAFALQPRQRRRIARAAEAFLAARPELAALALRFDVMVVEPRRLPRHLPGAWRAGD
jgi:putative endonuclease